MTTALLVWFGAPVLWGMLNWWWGSLAQCGPVRLLLVPMHVSAWVVGMCVRVRYVGVPRDVAARAENLRAHMWDHVYVALGHWVRGAQARAAHEWSWAKACRAERRRLLRGDHP